MEFIEDLDDHFVKFMVFGLENLQIVGNSTANNPGRVPTWNFEIDPANPNHHFIRPYLVDEASGHDFFRVVRDRALSGATDASSIAGIINVIDVYSRRIITDEENPIWRSVFEDSAWSYGAFLRDVYCLHVTDEMAKQIQEDGDEITESFHPSYYTYIQSVPMNPVDQLKEKMDTEGTISVEDALAGEPLVAKKPE